MKGRKAEELKGYRAENRIVEELKDSMVEMLEDLKR